MGVWARFKLTNDKFSIPNFQSVSLSDSPENADLKASLVRTGISATFHRLRWGLILSVALVVIMAASFAATTLLNQKARKSRDELITAYRLSWKIGIAAAMLEVALLVPLLAYGFFRVHPAFGRPLFSQTARRHHHRRVGGPVALRGHSVEVHAAGL
jgi:hypothetical protein